MEQYHEATLRKKGTGGVRRKFSDKKLSHMGGVFTASKASEKQEAHERRGRGGTRKVTLKYSNSANIVTKQGTKKATIRTVIESGANRHFARQNILTKGSVIDTELGKARITNRVGQDGVVNCVLI